MSAADVAYVVDWEQQTGITLNLAFNGIGACTAPTRPPTSQRQLHRQRSPINGRHLHRSRPGRGRRATRTTPGWSTPCWPTRPTSTGSPTPGRTCSWAAHVVAAPGRSPRSRPTARGAPSPPAPTATRSPRPPPTGSRSRPRPAARSRSAADGSVTLTWPEATNGTGTDGTPGPTLAQEEASYTGGTGFWGYNIYREDPGSTTYGLVGQVAENPAATASTTYSFTDTGATAPGAAPGLGSDGFPTATNPGIDCSSTRRRRSWLPATSTSADASIEQEIGLDQAFAAANGLTNYTPAAVVTGEHSGIENPNMPAALAGVGVTTFAQDASRQPAAVLARAPRSAPRATRATSTTTPRTGPTSSTSTTRCTSRRVTRWVGQPGENRPLRRHLGHHLRRPRRRPRPACWRRSRGSC